MPEAANVPLAQLAAGTLIVRPYAPGDAGPLCEAVQESFETVGRWLPWCHKSYGEADAVAWIEQCSEDWRRGDQFAFAVFDAVTRDFVGSAGLNQFNRQNNYANLGYWTRQSRQGQGISTAAARIVCAFGFDELALTRIEIAVASDNRASRRVAEKLGAMFEGVLRNRIRCNDTATAAALYSLIPNDLA